MDPVRDRDSSRDRLVGWLAPLLGLAPEAVRDELPLFSSGNLNSRRMLELVVFLEREWGVRMKALDVRLDNLDSVAKILACGARLGQARPQRG
jgi:acyl carrier protein